MLARFRIRFLRVGCASLTLLLASCGFPMLVFSAEAPTEVNAISFSDGERIFTSQCGLNVTEFLLEYFHLEYALNEIAARLEPNDDGIALDQMQGLLRAHGLQAEARSQVKVADLKRPLDESNLVVMSVKSGIDNQAKHYVLALHDPTRGYLLVDVPRTVLPLFDKLTDDVLASTTMLFVARHKDPPRLAEQLAIQPTAIDLGHFDVGTAAGQVPVDRVLTVENRGPQPIRVGLETSCPCMHLDWTGGYLDAGKSQSVRLRMFPGSWGLGRHTHPIFVDVPGVPHREIAVEAETVASKQPSRITLSRNSFTIDCSRLPTAGEQLTREVEVQCEDGQPVEFTATSDVAWLTPRIEPGATPARKLVVQADLQPDLFRAARSTHEGTVTIRGEADQTPVTVKFRLYRRDFFNLERSSIQVTKNAPEPVDLLITPVEGLAKKIELLSHAGDATRTDDPAGLMIEAIPVETGALQLRIRATTDAAIGQHIVRREMRNGQDQTAALLLLVNVAEASQ